MRTPNGFTIIELFVVIAIMGVIFAIGLPILFQSRQSAYEANAQTFAAQVYKVAYAHVVDNPDNTLVQSANCLGGYTAGVYSTASNNAINSCQVADAGDGTPVVTVVSQFGNTYTLP